MIELVECTSSVAAFVSFCAAARGWRLRFVFIITKDKNHKIVETDFSSLASASVTLVPIPN